MDKALLANYVCMNYVISQHEFEYGFLNDVLEVKKLEYEEVSTDYSENFPLVTDHVFIKSCVNISSWEIVRQIAEDVKVRMNYILENKFIQESSLELLGKNEWLGLNSTEIARQKLRSMDIIIGTFDFVLDSKKLDAYYESLDILLTDNRRIAIRKHRLFQSQNRLNMVLDPKQYALHDNRAYTVNANYWVQFNIACKFLN